MATTGTSANPADSKHLPPRPDNSASPHARVWDTETMKLDLRRHDILVLDDLLSDDQLQLLDSAASSGVFETQELGALALRHRKRSVIDDPDVPTVLWAALERVLGEPSDWLHDPDSVMDHTSSTGWTFTRCNPRTRIYSYDPGGSFSPHVDEPWRPDETTRTVLTVLVYLNAGGCTGGETVVDGEVIIVKAGRIVVFDHRLLHEGKPVETGTKLVLRSDVVATSRGLAKVSTP